MAVQSKPRKSKKNTNRALRKMDEVVVVTGDFTGHIGRIRSIDGKNHPDAPYFVMSDKDTDNDVYIMGRFTASMLEIHS